MSERTPTDPEESIFPHATSGRQALAEINEVISGVVEVAGHDFARQELLRIIAEHTDYQYGMLAEFQPEGVMAVTAVHAPPQLVNAVEKLVGFKLIGYRFPLDPQALETPPTEVFEHLSDFYPPIPRLIGTQIGKILGFREIVSIRQQTRSEYIGAATFATKSPTADRELLEYLSNNQLVYAIRLMAEKQQRDTTQEALRESEQTYRALFERTNDAVFFIGLDGSFLAVNQQAADMLGYEIDEFTALQSGDLLAPGERGEFAERIQQLLNGEKIPVYERGFLRKDGEMVIGEVNVALVLDGEGQPMHIQSIVRDITARKQAEEAVRDLARFATEYPNPTLRCTREGRLLYANPAAQTLSLPSALRVGESLPVELHELLGNLTSGQERHELEIQLGTSDYQVLLTDIEGSEYVNLYFRDVTEEKRADQMKTEFIASVSHELRTPLASILGFSEVLLDGSPGRLTEIQTEFLEAIYESSQTLELLVNDLLDVTRMEAGEFRLNPELIDLQTLTEKVIHILQPLAKEKNIQLRSQFPPDFPPLRADSERLQQVMNNLISNGVKFNKQGGQVTVQGKREDQDTVVIKVSDSGIGIAEADLPRLFTRFFRGENARLNSVGGTGLGLFITKKIIEVHGGEIEVESEENVGTRIQIRLPVDGPKE